MLTELGIHYKLESGVPYVTLLTDEHGLQIKWGKVTPLWNLYENPSENQIDQSKTEINVILWIFEKRRKAFPRAMLLSAVNVIFELREKLFKCILI